MDESRRRRVLTVKTENSVEFKNYLASLRSDKVFVREMNLGGNETLFIVQCTEEEILHLEKKFTGCVVYDRNNEMFIGY